MLYDYNEEGEDWDDFYSNQGIDYERFHVDPVGAIIEFYGHENETSKLAMVFEQVLPELARRPSCIQTVVINEDYPDIVDWFAIYDLCTVLFEKEGLKSDEKVSLHDPKAFHNRAKNLGQARMLAIKLSLYGIDMICQKQLLCSYIEKRGF